MARARAETQPVAKAGRAQAQVRAQGTQGSAAVPALCPTLLTAVAGDPDAGREGGLQQAAGRREEKGRPDVAEVERQVLGDDQGERDREPRDREPQRDGEAVAGGGADDPHRQDRRQGARPGQHAKRCGEADQRRSSCLPGGPGTRRRVEPGEAGKQRAGADRPLAGAVQTELREQRQPDRDRDQGAAAQRRPGPARPDRQQWRRSQAAGGACCVEELHGASLSLPAAARANVKRVRKVLPAVTGAGVVLAGDAIVVAVEAVGVFLRATVPEEEELGGSLAPEVGAVLVGSRSCRRQEQGRGDHQGGEAGEKRLTQG